MPTVSANVYVTSGQPVGGVGISDTFSFTPPFVEGLVSAYRYSFLGGASGTVPADFGGNGSLTWSPGRPGPTTLTVTAIASDGSALSCPLTYSFVVATAHH